MEVVVVVGGYLLRGLLQRSLLALQDVEGRNGLLGRVLELLRLLLLVLGEPSTARAEASLAASLSTMT